MKRALAITARWSQSLERDLKKTSWAQPALKRHHMTDVRWGKGGMFSLEHVEDTSSLEQLPWTRAGPQQRKGAEEVPCGGRLRGQQPLSGGLWPHIQRSLHQLPLP